MLLEALTRRGVCMAPKAFALTISAQLVEVQAPVSRLRLEEAIEFLPQLRQAADALAQTIDW